MSEHRIEPLWDAQIAIGAAIALDATLPGGLVLDARWVAPVLTAPLLGLLAFATLRHPRESRGELRRLHGLVLVLLVVVMAFDVGSLVALVLDITGHSQLSGGQLLRGSAQVWVATVLLFAVVFWELDRGGPLQRSADGPQNIPPHREFAGPWPDFYFPQMQDDCPAPANWMPAFADYLYVAATNSTAYSPTDTMPLTRIAKLAMVVQSGSSFVLFALVLGRAVSLLG